MAQFTFCATDDNPDTSIFLQEIKKVPESLWHHDQFRNCYILPLWNPGGQSGVVDPTIISDFQFTEAAEYCPELIAWIKPLIFKLKGRLTVLKTLPGMEMNVHLDCKKSEVGTMQYKWRMVISGNVNGLYFLNEHNERIYPNNNSPVYVMDGGHPHSIDADNQEKITVCIGAPWKGNPMPDNLEEPVKIKICDIDDKWSI